MKLKVPRSSTTTQIHFGIQEALEVHLPKLLSGNRTAIITDSTVKEQYGKVLEHLDTNIFTFPSGELSKTRASKAMLEDLLLSHLFGRDCLLIGMGGGVACDLVGFLASTYCRGVRLVLIPTTLLAMVDASVGGKTGVNTSYGKNMIGTFYPAEQVLIDGAFLKTLPPQEIANGMAEVIKYSLIHSKALFDQLDLIQNDSLDLNWIMPIIRESVKIKKEIVEEDPFEQKGRRRVLNYGHTIGHALEKLEHYALPHGYAVAIGMIVAAFISHEMGFLKRRDIEHIQNVCTRHQIRLKLSRRYEIDEVLSALALDKKTVKSTPRFVLLKAIGEVHPFKGDYCTEVPFEILEKSITWMNQQFF